MGRPWGGTVLARLAVEGTLAEQTVGHHEVEVVVKERSADRFTVTPAPATIDVVPVTHR